MKQLILGVSGKDFDMLQKHLSTMVTDEERVRFSKGRRFYNKPLGEECTIGELYESSRSIAVDGNGPTFYLNIDNFDAHNYFTDTLFPSAKDFDLFEGLEWPGLETTPIVKPKNCECGSDAVGSDRHSGYCPKYTRD